MRRTLRFYDRTVWLSKNCGARLYVIAGSSRFSEEGIVRVNVSSYGKHSLARETIVDEVLIYNPTPIFTRYYRMNSDSRLLVIPGTVIETEGAFNILIAAVVINSNKVVWVNEDVRTKSKYADLLPIIRKMVNVNIFGTTPAWRGMHYSEHNLLITYKPADVMNTFIEPASFKFGSIELYHQYPRDLFEALYLHKPFDYEKYKIRNRHRDTEVPGPDITEQTSTETVYTSAAPELFGTISSSTTTVG